MSTGILGALVQIRESDLPTPHARLCAYTLLSFRDASGGPVRFPEIPEIASACALNVRATKLALLELVGAGMLQVRQVRGLWTGDNGGIASDRA